MSSIKSDLAMQTDALTGIRDHLEGFLKRIETSTEPVREARQFGKTILAWREDYQSTMMDTPEEDNALELIKAAENTLLYFGMSQTTLEAYARSVEFALSKINRAIKQLEQALDNVGKSVKAGDPALTALFQRIKDKAEKLSNEFIDRGSLTWTWDADHRPQYAYPDAVAEFSEGIIDLKRWIEDIPSNQNRTIAKLIAKIRQRIAKSAADFFVANNNSQDSALTGLNEIWQWCDEIIGLLSSSKDALPPSANRYYAGAGKAIVSASLSIKALDGLSPFELSVMPEATENARRIFDQLKPGLPDDTAELLKQAQEGELPALQSVLNNILDWLYIIRNEKVYRTDASYSTFENYPTMCWKTNVGAEAKIANKQMNEFISNVTLFSDLIRKTKKISPEARIRLTELAMAIQSACSEWMRSYNGVISAMTDEVRQLI